LNLTGVIGVIIEEIALECRSRATSPIGRDSWILGRVEGLALARDGFLLEASALRGFRSRFGQVSIGSRGMILLDCRLAGGPCLTEPLADPRCFGRLAARLEPVVHEWARRFYVAFEAVRHPVEQPKLIALKAFHLAFEAIRAGGRSELVATLQDILGLLEFADPEEPETIRRRVLYGLALAGCQLEDPSIVRRVEVDGRKCWSLGGWSPVRPWREIIDKVCWAGLREGMIRRRRQSPRLPLGRTELEAGRLRRIAEGATGLPPAVLDPHRPFLRHARLEDLARFHRIY
jgi:hypothetical protein